MKVLVIPDLHCRDFWKAAVEKWDGPIVFLGDYVDPYSHEWDEDEQMPHPVDYLLEVVNFKDCNTDRVTLLLGNHDWHYIYRQYDGSRKNYSLQDKLHEIFTEDIEYFQIAKQVDDVLFTHAGVSKDWLSRHVLELPKEGADEYLNKVYDSTPDIFWEMSYERGGWDYTGSPIWHDVRELDLDETQYQIFGHSQTKENPIILENFVDLDCRRAFVVDTEIHKIDLF